MRQSSTARASTTYAAWPRWKRDRESLKLKLNLQVYGDWVDTSVSPRPEHPTHAARPENTTRVLHDWRWHQTTTAKRWPRGSMDRERRLRKRRRTSSQWTSDQVTTSTTSRTTAWKTTTSTRAIRIWLWTVREKWFGTVKNVNNSELWNTKNTKDWPRWTWTLEEKNLWTKFVQCTMFDFVSLCVTYIASCSFCYALLSILNSAPLYSSPCSYFYSSSLYVIWICEYFVK